MRMDVVLQESFYGTKLAKPVPYLFLHAHGRDA